jgi:tetratricopeptide (TPR) repeat protein
VRLFRRAPKPDPEALVQERWHTRFGWLERRRLPEERASDYRSFLRQGCFRLEILKPDCFAWVTGPYKYRDLVLEATLDFEPGNPHCATGFVLRYINEENFYYFLVSDKGSFRFDVVFNKNPIHLIEWTPCPVLAARPLELRLVARGDGFHFFADDQWIGEMSDGTIPEGACGFAGQNFSAGPRAGFRLLEYAVESRPVEVEKAYYRWVHFLPAPAAHRLQLARTFHSMGRYLETLVELKKAFRQGAGGAEERRLQADACLALKLGEEALEALEQSLALEPDNAEALLAKANTLFQCRRFLEARDFTAALLPRFPSDAALANLAGASEYSLGNWEQALASYRRAVELEPESPLYLGNKARVLERLGRSAEALDAYLLAARLLFRAETYDELSLVLARGRALASAEGGSRPAAQELAAYEAKMLFHEGKREEAEGLLSSLVQQACPDPAVHYLYGLVLIGRGARGEAEAHLARATEMDPSFPLYWFRLAENRHLRGADTGEALERALALDPEDPWINNLKGQVLLAGGQAEAALEHFRRALAKAPAEAALATNAAGALVALGRAAEAAETVSAAIAASAKEASLYNARGNARVALRDFSAALQDYEQALALDPDDPDYLANAAGCCLELDMVLRAEELLDRLLEVAPTASAYNLVGNLAVVQQDQLRAELAYQEALSKDPGNPEVTLNLASLYLAQGGYAKARETLAPLMQAHPELPRAQDLARRIRQGLERELACAGCDRRWWVPRELAPQTAFKVRGEPPGEAPAGRCEGCGKLFCIACAAPHAQGDKLVCPACGGRLRLSDDALKYLFLRCLESLESPG